MRLRNVLGLSLPVILLVGCEGACNCDPLAPTTLVSVEGGSYALQSVSDHSLTFAHSGVRNLRMEIDRHAGKVRVTYVRDGKPVEEFWTIAETTP